MRVRHGSRSRARARLSLVRRDVREIRDALVTVRGGWKALMLIVAISASLGAAISKFAPFVFWVSGWGFEALFSPVR